MAEEKLRRRRRSWYRRRLRIQRSLAAFVLVLVLGGVGWQSVAKFLASRTRQSRNSEDAAWTRGDIHNRLTALATAAAKPPHAVKSASVYPYSVIPGGVDTADDLERAVQHDRVVWEHYALFQFERARLVRANEAREVYLSYRLRNHIYWTRKRVRLHVGEMLITDGRITARMRCGNQVSDQPKPDVSEEEPEEDILDRPVAQLYPAPPLPMHSLLTSPPAPTFVPEEPGLNAFGFPYIPFGVPVPPQVCKDKDGDSDGPPCRHHHHKPPVVPEPSTILLISSGLAAVYWQYRRTSMARAR